MERPASVVTRRMGMVALALALAAALSLAGCQKAPDAAHHEAPGAEGQGSGVSGGLAEGASGGGATGMGSSACFAALTPEAAWAQADVICSATYLDHGEPFLVRGTATQLSPIYYADYRFEVDEVFSGELPESAQRSGVVTVREEVGGVPSNAEGLAPQAGDRGLLNLSTECRRAGFGTEGDHLYFLTEWNWWPELQPGAFRSEDGGSLSVEQLRASDPATAATMRHGVQNAAYLAEIEERYRAGEYSKEYYEKLRAEATSPRYGHIMTIEEQRAYESGADGDVRMGSSA